MAGAAGVVGAAGVAAQGVVLAAAEEAGVDER